jgi:formylmethanofuran:tetrahydromethanopterin formyltransferase
VLTIPNAMAAASNAETQCADVATTTADELAKCTATAMVESTVNTLPCSATFPEYTKPRRTRFGPLLQVWHEWSSRSAVSKQVTHHRIREPVMTSRTAELYLWQGQPCDNCGSPTSLRHCIGDVPCKLTSYNSFI